MWTSLYSSGVTRYMCAEWRHHHPGKFHCSRTEGKRRGTRPEKYVSFFTGSRNVAVLILCGLLSLKETVILFGLATQIVALLVLLAPSRSITSMEVLLWMVVIEVVWSVYFVVTERWHDKLACKAMLTV